VFRLGSVYTVIILDSTGVKVGPENVSVPPKLL
jgi:hypothetical protein